MWNGSHFALYLTVEEVKKGRVFYFLFVRFVLFCFTAPF